MSGMGWIFDTSPNVVLTTLKYTFACRSPAWSAKYKSKEDQD